MRHEPAFVDGVAVEAAGELIVNAAARHFFEGGFGHGAQMLFAGLLKAIENQVHCARRGEISGRARSRHF